MELKKNKWYYISGIKSGITYKMRDEYKMRISFDYFYHLGNNEFLNIRETPNIYTLTETDYKEINCADDMLRATNIGLDGMNARARSYLFDKMLDEIINE